MQDISMRMTDRKNTAVQCELEAMHMFQINGLTMTHKAGRGIY